MPRGLLGRHWPKAGVREAGATNDRQLLERFCADRDGQAFALLVEQHGPLVLGACHRILGNEHDAQDAFQATFLVLARKADALDRARPLAGWLYHVARNLSFDMRRRAGRRRRAEQAGTRSESALTDEPASDLSNLLDEELGRLPDKYRCPLVLCYLQGKTHEQAAAELGCPLGSMARQLEHGCTLLRTRLLRRGLHVPVALFAAFSPAVLAPALALGTATTTAQAAAAFLAPGGVGTVLSGATIAERTLTLMLYKKLATATAVVVVLLAIPAVWVAGWATLAGPRDGNAEVALDATMSEDDKVTFAARSAQRPGRQPGEMTITDTLTAHVQLGDFAWKGDDNVFRGPLPAPAKEEGKILAGLVRQRWNTFGKVFECDKGTIEMQKGQSLIPGQRWLARPGAKAAAGAVLRCEFEVQEKPLVVFTSTVKAAAAQQFDYTYRVENKSSKTIQFRWADFDGRLKPGEVLERTLQGAELTTEAAGQALVEDETGGYQLNAHYWRKPVER